MKAALLTAYGDVDNFTYGDAPDPVPTAGHVVIKVGASGLNPVDSYIRKGLLAKMSPMPIPAILGLDAAGTITALGPDVAGFAIGDRVVAHFPINGHGGHAELASVPVAGLAKLPASVSFAAGATLPVVALTAWQAVDALAGLKPGDRVLVSGALGGVGRATVQRLKQLGAIPVAGVRAARLAEAKAFAGEAIDIETTPAAPDLDFAVSTTPPAALNTILHVRDGGHIGSAVQVPKDANPNDRVKIAVLWTRDDPVQLQQIADSAGRGELELPIAATYRLSKLGEAHTLLASPHVGGKIVITP